MSSSEAMDDALPCSLVLNIPFPSQRLASIALRVISIDEELSPLVKRSLTLASVNNRYAGQSMSISSGPGEASLAVDPAAGRTLQVTYRATTNRMLRVAVNGFFESLGVVISTMRELDAAVANEEWVGDNFLPADGLGAEGATDGAKLKEEVDTLGRVQGLTEIGAL